MPENQNTQQTGNSDATRRSNPMMQAADNVKEFAAHKAAPGPAVPQNMPEQEGTKEERQVKAQELNK